MTTLVTGGAGYIGSVTTELLRANGEKVVIIDDLSRGHRAAVAADVPFYAGSVGDATLVRRVCAEHKVDACVHFAAFAYVGESVANPRLYFENNVAQGIALLGALLDGGVRHLVFSSTCATYGEPRALPISEDTPQQPTNPYGWTKLMLERVLASYASAYGLRYVALRYFNACGATPDRGEDHRPETHLIPIVLEVAAGRRAAVPVLGDDYETPDGTAIRDYIHVSDLATAHALALQHLRAGNAPECLNLGTGHGHSVTEVVEAARKVTGQPIPMEIKPRRPGDPARLTADPARARDILGWKATRTNLAEILDSAWRWMREHPDGYADDAGTG